MPLTSTGAKIRAAMRRRYGRARGDRVFYATANARGGGGRGRIGGRRIDTTRRRRRRPARRRRR
jgi:hypothetical protein